MRLKDRIYAVRKAWNGGYEEELRRFFMGEDSTMIDSTYEAVTSAGGLSSTAQFAAVRVLNETIGSLPINVYMKTESGREQAEDNNIYEIFHEKPNDEMTCQGLKEAGMMGL